MSWNRLFPKSQPTTYNPYEMEGMSVTTGEFPKNGYDDNPTSYGRDFNLILAVAEYGPQRVEEINKRLDAIETEAKALIEERTTLHALIQVVKPAP